MGWPQRQLGGCRCAHSTRNTLRSFWYRYCLCTRCDSGELPLRRRGRMTWSAFWRERAMCASPFAADESGPVWDLPAWRWRDTRMGLPRSHWRTTGEHGWPVIAWRWRIVVGCDDAGLGVEPAASAPQHRGRLCPTRSEFLGVTRHRCLPFFGGHVCVPCLSPLPLA